MTLKTKDIKKMNEKERMEKIKELKIELIKSSINTSKVGGGSKAKEIKKTLARIFAYNKKQD